MTSSIAAVGRLPNEDAICCVPFVERERYARGEASAATLQPRDDWVYN